MRIIPGVMKAAKTFQRGHAPEKRAKRMPLALKRFEMLPATSMRIMWKGTPSRAGSAQRREPVADLLEADAEAAADDVDVVALLRGRLEERRVRHEHRAGEVVRESDARERRATRRS